MLIRLKQFVQQQNLFLTTDKLLLGVSGGIDSVVLAQLVDQLGNEFAIAHCNFNLRGTESDEDEKFVASLSDILRVPFFSASFHTNEIASEKGISIEMAARELRYEWFEQIRQQHGYDYILVAHHQDDVLETFILNLTRSTGIRGLSGIKPKAGRVVRPMLFATRSDIETYASTYEISSRLDSSNDDQCIKRNKVRHTIIPLLEEINPAFRRNLHKTIALLNDTEQIYLQQIEKTKAEVMVQSGDWFSISIAGIKNLQPIETYLFELLRPFSFKGEMMADMVKALDKEPGTQFFSATHRLVVDRETLIVTSLETETNELVYINSNVTHIESPLPMHLSVEPYIQGYNILKNKNIAQLDYHKVVFPLLLRRWKKGEYFKPLGLNGFKKLSDFFVDEKMSIPEKESTWILSSEGKVAWVVGRRIDDRFKITPETTLILKIDWTTE
jgi:tRNA(Ile)-lysidine synthase